MTEYQSKTAVVSRPPYQLYMAFVDMRNFLQYLPEDKRQDVTADYDSLHATVQGFGIGVRVVTRLPYSRISLVDDGAPFRFNVDFFFDAAGGDPDKTEFHINVAADLSADKSIYRFYQELLALRKAEKTLIHGNTIEYYPDDRQVISYSRCLGDKRFLIVGNFSGVRADFIMPGDFELDELTIRMTNRGRTDSEVEEIMHMLPYEAILFEEKK